MPHSSPARDLLRDLRYLSAHGPSIPELRPSGLAAALLHGGGAAEVSAAGATVGELLDDLERAHPGIRFRMIDEQDCIRPHIRIFVNQNEVKTLDEPLRASDRVHLICALSGG